jgi:hypothetical protein
MADVELKPGGVGFECPVTISARDEFNQSPGALTGKTAAVGVACGPCRTRQCCGCTMSRSQCTFFATCRLTL